MDYEAFPSFSKCDSSGSSKYSNGEILDYFSLGHPFHLEFYTYIKQQATNRRHVKPIKKYSFHVQVPDDPEGSIIA